MKPSILKAKSSCIGRIGLAVAVCAGPVWAQQLVSQPPRYSITDLGTVGNPPGGAYSIASNGLAGGAAPISATRMHAVLWYNGLKLDIGAHGLGGPNSAAYGVNAFGQAVGPAESSVPNGEDFCGFNAYGFPSATACLPFVWQNGLMTKLPTLGGANGVANWINHRGEVAGWAENTTQDMGCPVSQFEPVLWENGRIHELPTFPGDAYGVAASINQNGQIVGASGTCATTFNPNSGLYLVEDHALLWENGTMTDLGNLGGTGGLAGNHACAINNRGQVVGHSELLNDTTFHGFLWTRETGMRDLGTLTGDYASVALNINDGGEVVGASLSATFSSRAFLWKKGRMTDLNTLVVANPSRLNLLQASAINSRGEIVGLGVTSTGEAHAFLATPR